MKKLSASLLFLLIFLLGGFGLNSHAQHNGMVAAYPLNSGLMPHTPGNGNLKSVLNGNNHALNKDPFFDSDVISAYTQNNWSQQTPMPGAKWGNATAFLKSCNGSADTGYVYAISGADASFNQTNSVYRYNTFTKTWTSVSNFPASKLQISATVIKNKIYVPGGYTGSFSPDASSYVYDPNTNAWTSTANLLQATGDYAIGTYKDSLMYVIGGYNGSIDLNAVQIYNPITNSWSYGTAFPGTATAGLRMGIADGIIILVGGYSQVSSTSLNQAWKGVINPNNPTDITWTQISNYPNTANGRFAAGTSSLNDGRVYFAAGDPDGGGMNTLVSSNSYNVRTNTWEAGPNLSVGVSNISNFFPFIQNDSLFMGIVGGYNGSNAMASFQSVKLDIYANTDNALIGADTAICIGESIQVSTQSTHPFLWSPASAFLNPEDTTQILSPITDVEIKITQYPHFGCPLADSIEVLVNPLPVVSISTLNPICVDNNSFILTEGSPAGGTYIGSGINAGIFDASSVGLGTHDVDYAYTDANGCSDTASAQIVVIDCLGIDENEKLKINVFPNPLNNILQIQSQTNSIEQIDVLTMSGQRLLTREVNSSSTSIQTENWAKGVYLLYIKIDGNTLSYKVSKQ